MTDEVKPYIPASQKLPELTVGVIILGCVLAVVLGGANAYLGMFAGMTVSASVPAAVISMAILRALRTGNILQNNAVQTAAASGEGLAAAGYGEFDPVAPNDKEEGREQNRRIEIILVPNLEELPSLTGNQP